MPELPEVETVCRGLAKVLPGHVIKVVQQNRAALRVPFPAKLKGIVGSKIAAVDRRAKYILFRLDCGRTLIVHLGMSGRLTVREHGKKYVPEKHDHMLLFMDDGTLAVFNDPRRFGLVALADTDGLERHRLFAHLGPEPLEKKFTAGYLAGRLKGRKVAIKLAVMDQRLVVGVGNIYASEALFEAGIDPRRLAKSLTLPETKKLVAAIGKVLKAAIRAGGSSLRDYVQTDGGPGYFQHHWAVYGKAGQKCRGCTCDIRKTGGVRRVTQGGRSTFYCPAEQR